MARLFSTGFEIDTLSSGYEILSVTNGTLDTTIKRSGARSFKCAPATTNHFVRQQVFLTNSSTIGYTRFYMYIETAPPSAFAITRFANVSDTSCGQLTLDNNRVLRLVDGNGTVQATSSAIPLNTWTRIEMKMDPAGTVEGKIDGTTFGNVSGVTTGTWGRVNIGFLTGTPASGVIYLDDWAINDSSGSSENSWPGDSGGIYTLFPDGDGTSHAWNRTNGTDAGTSLNYQLMNDPTVADTTAMIQSNTLNALDMYTMANHGLSNKSVSVVHVAARISNNSVADTTTACKLQVVKTGGGTVAESGALIPNSTTFRTTFAAPTTAGAPALPPITLYADPDGAAWTLTTIDSMQAGIKLTATGTNRIRATALWVTFDTIPASALSKSDDQTGTFVDNATRAVTAAVAEFITSLENQTAVGPRKDNQTGTFAEAAVVDIGFSSVIAADKLYETFDGGLANGWSLVSGDADDTGGYITLPVVDGQVSAISYAQGLRLNGTALPVKVAPDTTTSSFFTYRLSVDSLNYVEFGVVGPPHRFTFRVVKNGAKFEATDLFNAQTDLWWRFREQAGILYWDTSANSSTWVNRFVKVHGLDVSQMKLSFLTGSTSSPLYGVGVYGEGVYGA